MEIQNKYLAIQSIKKSKGIVLLILTSIFNWYCHELSVMNPTFHQEQHIVIFCWETKIIKTNFSTKLDI